MAEPLNHARIVFTGVLPDRRDVLAETMRFLEPEHFANEVERTFWKVLVKFYDLSGGVLTRRFIDQVGRTDAARAALMGEIYDQCAAGRVTDSEVKVSVQVLKRIREEQLTAEALTRGMEILTRGGEIDGKEVEASPDSAWSFIQSEYSRITHLGSLDTAPEGDVLTDREAGIADYAARKALAGTPAGAGIRTGLSHIDRATGGLQPGEVMLVVGYTTAGKSMFCTQTAWHAAVSQGKNVFYATSETTRDMTRRRIYARHSRLDRFGVQAGLNSADLKQGLLSESGEATLKAVVEDLAQGAKTGEYGHLYVAQVPPDASWQYVSSAARRISTRWKIDLVVIDYLALLKADRHRDSQVAEFTDMLKSVKMFATSHDDGKGVPVMSPWAVQQPQYLKALEKREYTLASLSDTSEAEKTPDVLLWLLKMPDEIGKLRTGFLKTRDGEIPPHTSIDIDYRSTYLGDSREMANVEDLIGARLVMRPLEDRLFVRREGGFTTMASLLVVVEDKPQIETGIVEGVGPDAHDVSIGDRVIFDRYAGDDYDIDHVFLKLGEVLALVGEGVHVGGVGVSSAG